MVDVERRPGEKVFRGEAKERKEQREKGEEAYAELFRCAPTPCITRLKKRFKEW